MKIEYFLPNIDKNVRIELRLFEIAVFLTVLVFFFWTIISFYINYTLFTKSIYIACTVYYSLIYVAQKRNVSFNLLATAYFVFSFIVLMISWFPAGGITGAILQFVILVFFSGLLVLPIRTYLVFVLITVVTVISFSIYEFYNPGSASPYLNEVNRIRDVSIASIVTIIMLGFSLFIFKKSYWEDRDALTKAIKTIGVEKLRAESADKAKSQFLATISHEMRTPLNGIVGLSEILAETKLDGDQAEMVRNLQYSSNLLYSLISDVLDLTTIADENLALNETKIHLKKEIRDIVEIFKPRIDAKKNKLDLTISLDESIPTTIYGDLIRVRQVLINLINNAIKFTNEGFIKVRAIVLANDDEVTTIQFSVEDSGIGISESDRDKIFTRFFRTNVATEVEGTGLGLTISKQLVDLMGGSITFSSELGKGSIFTFVLPFKSVSNVNFDEQEKSNVKRLTNLKVLIAEDVPINQMVLKKMLTNLGVTDIDIASDGEEALKHAKNKIYDLVLMDIQMPKMDGTEASKRIRDYYNGNMPFKIIAVTANVMKEDFELYKKSGIVDVLSKPVNMKMLTDVLTKYT